MNKTYILIALWMIALIGMVGAEVQTLGKFNNGETIYLKQIDNASYCNISSVSYPNSSIIITNQEMTKNGVRFNYTLDGINTHTFGEYIVDGDCNGVVWSYNFYIGAGEASGAVVVLFSILFILLVGLSLYLALYSIGHLLALDFDMVDLAFDFGLFFAILSAYALESFYLGNQLIEQYFLWFLSSAGIFLILIPIIAFVCSITIGSLSKGRMQGVDAPQKIRFRRGR